MSDPRLPDAEQLTALLRIVAVPVLIVGEVYIPKPEPSDTRFFTVLAAVRGCMPSATLVVARRQLRSAHRGSGSHSPTSRSPGR